MSRLDIARRRLVSQHLTKPVFSHAHEVVHYLGAVQAQDYAGAKWALGQRLKGGTDAAIEQAMTEGSILRTHVLRPTWHFVTPEDIRWMLVLTAPRVRAFMASYDRKLELTDAVYRRSNAALTRALQGGRHLTRLELRAELERASVRPTGTQRLAHLVARAELDGLICSGPRRGKQFTYALLDERVPPSKPLERDEALFELTKRYFASRGPATAHDFSWWSGLTIGDARKGIEMAKSWLEREVVGEKPCWFRPPAPSTRLTSPLAHLLPNYDEYFIGFKDRSAIGETMKAAGRVASRVALAVHIMFIDGQIVGGWKRIIRKDSVVIESNMVTDLTPDEDRAVAKAVKKYSAFLGVPVGLT
ncbi:MAG: winged helix DNA-binding domain-containing protein [Gemmatimonadaceae bacterium]